MRRPPRASNAPLLSRRAVWQIVYVSALVVGASFGAFYWALGRGLPLDAARTLVVNTIVMLEIAYLFSIRYTHGTSFTWRGAMGTPAVLMGVAAVTLAQLAFTYVPTLQRLFDTRPLGVLDGAAVVGIGIALMVLVEIEKLIARRIFDVRS